MNSFYRAKQQIGKLIQRMRYVVLKRSPYKLLCGGNALSLPEEQENQ